jgi:translocation and assembly module TamB
MALRRVRRAVDFVGHLLAGVIVMLVLMGAGLWWWAGTEGSLDWVLQRLSRSQPLHSEGVSGSLRSGLKVRKLTWEREGLRAEAHDVLLEWAPVALLTRTVQLDEFRARLLVVVDERAPSDPKPPENIALPMRVRAKKVEIGRIEWRGRSRVQAEALAGAYEFNGLGHELKLDSLRVAGGQYQGTASLGVLDDMPLESTLQGTVTTSVPGGTATLPLRLQATAKGPLADFRAEARLNVLEPPPEGAAPSGTVTARITPFTTQPLPEAHARLQSIDLGALWPQAPRTALSGEARVLPAGARAWRWQGEFANAAPGAWDEGALPVDTVNGRGEWRGKSLLVESLTAQVGGGTVEAEGRWRGSDAWTLDARLRGVDPAAVHTAMVPQPLGGMATLTQDGDALGFDVALAAQGAAKARGRKDTRSAEQREKAPDWASFELRDAKARGRWSDGTLALSALDVRTRDAQLNGVLTVRPASRSGEGRLVLTAPGIEGRANGAIAEASGDGTLRVQARDIGRAVAWLRGVPVAGDFVKDVRAAGTAQLDTTWRGGWKDPAVQATLNAERIEWRDAQAPAAAWQLRDARATVNGRLSDAQLALRAQAEQGGRKYALDTAGRAGRTLLPGGGQAWRVQLPQLALSAQDPAVGEGVWRLALSRPLQARWLTEPGRLDVEPGAAVLTAPVGAAAPSQAQLQWDATRWGGGALQTSGRLNGLPMGWVSLLGGAQVVGSALTGNMIFDAQWNVSFGNTLRLDASLARRSGDINVLADTVDGASTRVAAGVRDARLLLEGRGDNVTLTLRWASERAGTADARIVTRLAQGGAAGWRWPEQAPLGGFVRAQLPRIGVWSLLAPPGWRLRGSLSADVALGGTRAEPRMTGGIAADDLALRSVVEGVELRDGRLRARLEGQRLRVDEFMLYGAGEGQAKGRLVARGEGGFTAQGLQLDAVATLTRLRASIRSDRDVTVSGELAARVDASGTDLRGKLAVDQARIVVPDELPPRLGDDVVVHRAEGRMATPEERKQREPTKPPPQRPFKVAVDLDLGNDFRVRGRGVNTELRGTVALTADSLTQPRLAGTVRTSGGEFEAYGQRLDIERGILRFNGAPDNPVLDVLAVRPHITQRVGVRVTGTAQAPYIRLYSEPELSDAEKLTWLVTGRPAAATGQEAALVQRAALALLAARAGNSGGGIASRVGLDELSVRRDSTEGAVVTLGKRFARNFYASYERSLSGALGTLYIFYDVSRRLTVRGEAGERTAIDLIYTFAFDGVGR